MKRTFALVFLLCGLMCRGQNTFSYHGGKAYGSVSIGNSVFYVQMSPVWCCHTAMHLNKVRNGKIVSGNNLSTIIDGYNPLIPLIDGTADQQLAVVSASNHGVCDSHTDKKLFISKIDTLCITTWKVPINVQKITHLIGLEDSSIIFAADNKLYRLNFLGVLTDTLNSGIGTIQSLCRYSADSFLVNHLNAAGANIKKVSNKLDGGADVLVGTTNEKMQVLNDSSLVALSGGKLIRYNKAFVWTGSSDNQIPPSTYVVKQFTIVNDTIYCTATGIGLNAGELTYMVLDKSFSVLFHTKANFENAESRGIALTGNKVNIVTTSPGINVLTNNFIDIIHLAKKGPLVGAHDIGVASASVTANASHPLYAWSDISATVTVKNFGNTPVNSFFINFYGRGVGWCWWSTINQHVNHFLAPGDSVTIDSLFVQTTTYRPAPGDPWTAEICFFTSVPDNTHDIIAENDAFCATTLVVGVDDHTKTNPFLVFPNPGRGTLNVKGDVPISEIKIFSVTGQLFLNIDNEGRAEVNITHELPPGVYLMVFHSGEKSYTRRLIVED